MLLAYAGLAAYYRFRPQPAGINGTAHSYRVPAEAIRFLHNTTWFDGDERQTVQQIVPEVLRLIRGARRFVVLDVFLLSLQHAERADDYLPTTRRVAQAFAESQAPAWVIVDPINTSYGSYVTPPLRWLQREGVNVCVTDLRKLRDNNLLYAPLWRVLLQWVDPKAPPRLRNPLEPKGTITLWSALEALNARGNHRKVLIADDGDAFSTLIMSSNLEDAGSYFGDTGVIIRSNAVARHYLEAEQAVARMSGGDIPVTIPVGPEDGDAEVTPLHGERIKQALVRDIRAAMPPDRLFICAQFLAERELIEALVAASRRGVEGTLVLDQSKVDFGAPKSGYPNQITAPELARRTDFEIRWANVRRDEFHNQFMLVERGDRCVLHIGSANYNRRSLSNTVLEANVRVDAPASATVSRDACAYARWIAAQPRSLPYHVGPRQPGLLKYAIYRFLHATGSGTF